MISIVLTSIISDIDFVVTYVYISFQNVDHISTQSYHARLGSMSQIVSTLDGLNHTITVYNREEIVAA